MNKDFSGNTAHELKKGQMITRNITSNITRSFNIHMSVHCNIIPKLQPTRYNVSWFIYFCGRSTCFRPFLRPSSGARNCTCSFRYCQTILLLAATMEEIDNYW